MVKEEEIEAPEGPEPYRLQETFRRYESEKEYRELPVLVADADTEGVWLCVEDGPDTYNVLVDWTTIIDSAAPVVNEMMDQKGKTLIEAKAALGMLH